MSITIKKTVESYDVQPNGNIKISSLMKYLQKAAGDDIDKTPLEFLSLASNNIAFVLTKVNLKILKEIKFRDELTIISHPRKVRGAIFPRDFIVKVNNETRAVVKSMWVLIDLEKRTILRPSAIDSIGDLPPSEEDLFELEDVRRIIDENSLSRTDVLRVQYSQLDMNNHLNNTFYSDFIFNLIDKNKLSSDAGMYLQINYKSEARLGDTLNINYCENDNEYDFSAVNLENDKICFSAYVSYDK